MFILIDATKGEYVNVRMLSNKFHLTPLLLAHLERQTMLAFSRIKNHIHSVTICLRELKGPRGGKDMLCQVVLVVPGCPEIVVREAQDDMYAAIDRAVKRASKQVARLIAQRSSKHGFALPMASSLVGAN